VTFIPDGKALATGDRPRNSYRDPLTPKAAVTGNASSRLVGGPGAGFSPPGKSLATGNGIPIRGTWPPAGPPGSTARIGIVVVAFGSDGKALAA
jgi:hypothetical protein